MNLELILLLYVIINLLTFFIFAIDKLKAIQNKWRVSEKSLLFLSIVGPLGSLLSMMLFHHKIRKIKFIITIPLFLLLHIFVIYILLDIFN